MSRRVKSPAGRLLEGLAKRHPDGFGFLIPDDPEAPDVYIPRHEMAGVMSNDRVRVRLVREPGGRRWRGELQEVVSRASRKVTGAYSPQKDGTGLLKDVSLAWGSDLKITNPNRLQVREGDFVVAEILSYPGEPQGFTGRLQSVIGDAADPLNDSLRVLHLQNIPFEFSEKARREARALPKEVSPADIQGRKDLRHLSFVTIDGRTAKDFDDAIYVERSREGFRLWVAIADVSHYVKPGTAIDDEAYERGTSTYFPNFVSPMLPEELSNELCSLKPDVVRLAFVVEMELSYSGELKSYEFYEATILSRARVIYGEAQEVIDGVAVPRLAHVAEMLKLAADVAKILMAKRFKEGSLDLEIPETEIEVDAAGEPVDIMQTERLFAHRLIEEFMLVANIATARQLTDLGQPCLFRIHEEPSPDAMEALTAFLEILGSRKRLAGGSLQKKITRALEDFRGHPQEHILHVLTLRSMAQARYSAENVGHFGLGFSHYAHFTSPIRRYPDLAVHRQLKAALKIGRGYQLESQGDLESAGAFLSACEQRSVKGERLIKAIKKARFMQKHLGQEFEGMISSITKFGLFVILRQFDVDGLVRLEALPGGRWEYDEDRMEMVAARSGLRLKVGDPLKIVVAAANIDEGKIDFVPAEEMSRARPPERHKK